MAIDPNSISSIGRSSGGTAEAVGRGLSLAEMVDQRQLRQAQMRATQQESADRGAARGVLQSADLSSFEGQQKAAQDVTRINPQMGMELLRGFQQSQATANQSTAQNYEILGHQIDLQGKAAAGLIQEYDQMVASGVPEQQAVAAMTPKWQQTIQQLHNTKLPNGQPALSDQQIAHLQQNPGFDPNTVRTVAQHSQDARVMLNQQAEQRRKAAEDAETKRHNQATESVASQRLKNTSGTALTDEAAEYAAQEYRNSGKLPPGIARSSGAAAKILNRAADMALAEGDSPKAASLRRQSFGAASGALKDLTKRKALIKTFEDTALKNIDLAVSEAEKLGMNGSPIMNRALVQFQKGVQGDPQTARYVNALIAARTEYAKVLSGSTSAAGITEGARHEAEQLFSTASSLDQLKEVAQIARAEMHNRTVSFDEQEQDLKQRMGLEPPAPAPNAPQAAPNAPRGTFPNAPPIGTIEDGHSYQGGDPADPASWRAVNGG